MPSTEPPTGTHAGRVADSVSIRSETSDDRLAVRDVHARAFGPGEPVSDLVDALRSAPAPLTPRSFVAVAGDRILGHVMLSASRLDAPRRIVDVWVLSPLGVVPEAQRQGIGSRLVAYALDAAAQTDVPLVFLEGSPHYYGSRGFERASALGFRSPSLRIPDVAFQVARLPAYEPWMTGTLVYSDTFWALDCVGLRDPDA
jgi:putative acetyltransferase